MAGPGPVLRMSVSRSGDTAVLRLAGEADISGQARLRGRLTDLLADGRPDPVRQLVVDAADLTFLDVSCLQTLLAAADRLRARGGAVALRSPRRRVLRLLTVLDVADALEVER